MRHLIIFIHFICSDVRPLYVETVPLPQWLLDPEMDECGERTFFDGDWFFVSDQDGFESGPFRYTIIYVIRFAFSAVNP